MKKYNIIGEPANLYFDECDENAIITDYDRNDDIDAQIIGVSSGEWFFQDNASTVRISRRINIGYIKYDEYRGYIYRNGKTVKELA